MEYVEVARALSERGEVVVRQRRDPEAPQAPRTLELRINGVFVMDTLETTSETALARASLARVASPRSVLVGGLGLGFTAHEVLCDRRVERVVVAEIEEPLVGWFRDGTVPHGPAFLADGRVCICIGDVRQVVAEAASESFDLVLLDVDNGPDFLVLDSNAEVYGSGFLQQVRRVLRQQGLVAVWSSTESAALAGALEEVFGNSTSQCYPVTLQGREDSYWLQGATKG